MEQYTFKVQAAYTVTITGFNLSPGKAQEEVERQIGSVIGCLVGQEMGTLVNPASIIAAGLVPNSMDYQPGGTSYIMMVNRSNEKGIIEHRFVEYPGRPVVLDDQQAGYTVDKMIQGLEQMYGKQTGGWFNQSGYGTMHFRNEAKEETTVSYMSPEKYQEENWTTPVERGW